ncbi:hypothetical protein [Sphingobium sp.]|uniref:hypothetical protein n=1 Tax=Sphingobium sp. TaxID=1912891 RepID=UPI0028BE7BFD|nr:hypothetical protein [Sphingobium sp.]
MYEIMSQPGEGLVRVAFTGFPEEVGTDPLRRDLADHIRLAKAGGASFDLLLDLRRASILPQSQIGGATGILDELASQGLRRVAVLVGSMLMKLQVRRIMAASTAEIFGDEEEALIWLASQSRI